MPCGLFPHAPGSQAGFLPLRPLRTARASVPSSRSSLANAPCGARWCHVSLLALDLPGAGGVQDDTVGRGLPAPMRAPDPVMVVPSCASGALLGAHRTETVWLLPQGPQVPAAFEGVCHLHAEAFFAGPFPLGVIRVCCACEFDLPVHGHVPCTTEREVVGVPLGTRACPHEGPLASVVRANVLLPTPRPDVFGGLRVAQDPRRLQMAVSTVMQVAWRTTWRCECAHPRITGLRWAISWPAVVGLVACTMARRFPGVW